MAKMESGLKHFQAAMEEAANGAGTIIYDRFGKPSMMVRIPKFYLDEVIAGAPHIPHPAKHIDQSPESKVWQPIMLGEKSIKYSETEDGIKVTTDDPEGSWNGCRFTSLETDIEVPDVLKALGLFPADSAEMTDYFWAGIHGGRLPLRGGSWNSGAGAGVCALNLIRPRSYVFTLFGFRAAYVG